MAESSKLLVALQYVLKVKENENYIAWARNIKNKFFLFNFSLYVEPLPDAKVEDDFVNKNITCCAAIRECLTVAYSTKSKNKKPLPKHRRSCKNHAKPKIPDLCTTQSANF